MIAIDKLSKSFGGRVLFENVTMSFSPGNRYALTGPNGCGKSTFLRIVMGREEATTGTVSRPDRVGFLRQNIESFLDFRLVDTVIMGNERLWNAMAERDKLYDVEMTDEVGMRLGDLEGIIAEEDGYSADSEAEILLLGMGIDREFHEQKMSTVPTDLQFRVLLCQALFGDPEALLLDEPTNHLDLDSIAWLEKFLHSYNGVLIVISHDRHFLNAVTTHVADIDYETVIIYPGNYDDMVEMKLSSRERAEADARSKEKKISQLREFVARFGAGTRASQVQSRLREIDRLQPQDLKKTNIERPYIRFSLPEKQSGKVAIQAKEISKSYDDIPVIKNFSIEIHRGDKIGIIGANGRGKTTLLKMLAEVLPPDAGQVEVGHQTNISYFPQNHSELIDKSKDETGFDWLRSRHKGAYDQELRSALGKMLFGGDNAFKSVAKLSGGETARLILADMILHGNNLLLLDEPNNHLDLEAVSALAWGLNDYKGTVVVVSHDRDLISNVANKIIAFEPNGIRYFEGNLDEYLSQRS